MVGRNNLLLLDEPTNNLDPGSRRSVTDALVAGRAPSSSSATTPSSSSGWPRRRCCVMPDGEVDYFSPGWLDLVALA